MYIYCTYKWTQCTHDILQNSNKNMTVFACGIVYCIAMVAFSHDYVISSLCVTSKYYYQT